MANFVFNISKGRVAELARRVFANDPANSVLVVVPVDVGAVADATLRDFSTLAAILAGGVTERTTGGWTRKTLDDTAISAPAADNTADVMNAVLPALTWTQVASGSGGVTDLIVCYRPDSTSGTDSALIPLTQHDFISTPDGSNVQADGTAGFYQAS